MLRMSEAVFVSVGRNRLSIEMREEEEEFSANLVTEKSLKFSPSPILKIVKIDRERRGIWTLF